VECVRSGKSAFGTRELAEARAFRVAQTTKVQLRPYRCQYCGCWHLTTKPLARR
jgi:hypothetical protein